MDELLADKSDITRSRIGLALCLSGALAWAMAAILWLAPALNLLSLQGAQPVAAAFWLTSIVAELAGLLLLASTRGAREVHQLTLASCSAFAVSLLAHSAALGLSSRPVIPTESYAHAREMWDLAIAWARGPVWIGSALLAAATARLASHRVSWARILGACTIGTIVAAAMVEDVAFVSPDGARNPWVTFTARVVVPALLGVLIVAAWRGLLPLANDESKLTSLADAVRVLPIALGARVVVVLTAWLASRRVDGHSPAELGLAFRVAAFDELLGLLTIACVLRLALAPAPLRGKWPWIALACCAVGHVSALTAAGHPLELLQSLGASSFGVLGGVRPEDGSASIETEAIAHLAGAVGVGATSIAIEEMARALAQPRAARQARRAVAPFIVATAATMHASTNGSVEERLAVPIAIASCTLGIWWLFAACLIIARTLVRTIAPAKAATRDEQDAASDRTLGPPRNGDCNPYEAPSTISSGSRGRLGSRKLAQWRSRVRRAIPWTFVPPIAYGLTLNLLLLVGGLSGTAVGTAGGYAASARSVGFELILPFTMARVAARSLVLGGVFAATRRPPILLNGLDPWLRSVTRLTASVALAAQAACATIAIAYGVDAAADTTPWTNLTDHVAYSASALYGARMLAAADRKGPALVLKGVSLGFAALAVTCFVVFREPEGALLSMRIDAFATASLAVLAVMGATAVRGILG